MEDWTKSSATTHKRRIMIQTIKKRCMYVVRCWAEIKSGQQVTHIDQGTKVNSRYDDYKNSATGAGALYVTQTRNVNSDHSILDNIVYHTQPSSIFFFFFTTFPFPLLTPPSPPPSLFHSFPSFLAMRLLILLLILALAAMVFAQGTFFSSHSLSRQYETTIY